MLDNSVVLNVAVVRHVCRVLVQEEDAQVLQRQFRLDLSCLTQDDLFPAVDAARSAEFKEIRREPRLLEHEVKARLSTPHCLFQTCDFEPVLFRYL